MANEVISYLEMCSREGTSLQRGMNFGLSSDHSVVLMSLRLMLRTKTDSIGALLVPDRSHSKLAVGARYAPEVPPRQVGKHRITLEAQPPAQSRCVQDLAVLGHLYPVKFGLLHQDWNHTEIIDTLGENIDKLSTSRSSPRTQGESEERAPRVVCSTIV